MISSYICDDFYIFWFLYISIDSSFFQNSFPIWKTLFKRNLKCEKSPSSIHISRNQIQLFSCLSCLFFCVRGCALSISLTLMNKKIHETRFPGNLAYRSPAFWFSRTQMRQQHRSIQIQTLLQHIVFIQKPLTAFMIFTPFLFPISLVGILSLYAISVNPFFDCLLLLLSTHACPVTIVYTLCGISSRLSWQTQTAPLQ